VQVPQGEEAVGRPLAVIDLVLQESVDGLDFLFQAEERPSGNLVVGSVRRPGIDRSTCG
jgi:hypothetical protein